MKLRVDYYGASCKFSDLVEQCQFVEKENLIFFLLLCTYSFAYLFLHVHVVARELFNLTSSFGICNSSCGNSIFTISILRDGRTRLCIHARLCRKGARALKS